MQIRSLLSLALRFLKLGTIGFGGGSALIPIIHKELVADNAFLTEEEYLKHTVVANITPGALPVKLGATCGLQLAGSAGSLMAAYATMLPGVLGTVLILYFFTAMGPDAIHYLNYASIGITVFIIYLLLHYVVKTVKSGKPRVNLALCLAAFLLTGGKEVREIIQLALGLPPHALGTPLFDLSMITVMILSFYGIALFLLADGVWARLVIGASLGLVYAVLSGPMLAPRGWTAFVRIVALAAMLATLAILLLERRRRGPADTPIKPESRRLASSSRRSSRSLSGRYKRRVSFARSIVVAAVAFLALPAGVAAYGLAVGRLGDFGALAAFVGNVAISTVTSFGGGEAYVAVADSVFVGGGYCGADMFYGRIVPVANALPGPILVKIAAAIGYVWGDTVLGGGALPALLAALLSAGSCSALALIVLNYYEALRHSVFMLSLKRYILPVICGTLLSTSLAMLYESMKTAAGYGCSPDRTALAMLACVAPTYALTARVKVNDIILLLCWTAASMGYMLVFL